MTDDEASRDELLQPSLSVGAVETDPPYNIFYALVPGFLGGPPAVTIAMVLIARRLRAPKLVMVAIVAIGLLTFVTAAVLIGVDVGASSGAVFRVAALITYVAQLPLLIRRFRSWQLRGKDTAPFVAAGFAIALVGVVLCLVVGVAVDPGE